MKSESKILLKLLLFVIPAFLIINFATDAINNYIHRDEIKAGEERAQQERLKRIQNNPNRPDFSIKRTEDIEFSDSVRNLSDEDIASILGIDYKEFKQKYSNTIKQNTTKGNHKTSVSNQNKNLTSQASKAYGFIIANDYKTVKYCSQYYTVKNLKQKFDAKFKDKKLKAESILNQSLGKNGAEQLKTKMISNKDVLQLFHDQVEEDYQLTKRTFDSSLTRAQYCKNIDDYADDAVKSEYNKFQKIVPGF